MYLCFIWKKKKRLCVRPWNIIYECYLFMGSSSCEWRSTVPCTDSLPSALFTSPHYRYTTLPLRTLSLYVVPLPQPPPTTLGMLVTIPGTGVKIWCWTGICRKTVHGGLVWKFALCYGRGPSIQRAHENLLVSTNYHLAKAFVWVYGLTSMPCMQVGVEMPQQLQFSAGCWNASRSTFIEQQHKFMRCQLNAACWGASERNTMCLGVWSFYTQSPSILGWIMSPLISVLKPYSLVPQNGAIFGDGVFKEGIKVKWGH